VEKDCGMSVLETELLSISVVSLCLCSICCVLFVFNGKTNDIAEEQTTGYGYDELKDFDMGYKDSRQGKITPFMGRLR
jgi:hypothetical protein